MAKEKDTLTIEIIKPNKSRDTWYNQLVGKKLEAKKVGTLGYKIDFKEPDGSVKFIPLEFACAEGEAKEVFEEEAFPITDSSIKFIEQVRVFVVKEDLYTYDRKGEEKECIHKKGEVWHEMYDKPNHIYLDGEVKKLKDINSSIILLPIFDCTETIDARESNYFLDNKHLLRKKLNSAMRSRERIERKIDNLHFLLGLQREDE